VVQATDTLQCWKCGAAIEDLPLPLARAAECRRCGADLHVCRLCEYFDRRAARSCREPVAEPVNDKERANFCGYFRAQPGAFAPADTAGAEAAKTALDSLFGNPAPGGDAAPATSDAARSQLEMLFGLDKPDKKR
jgi:hypothetical protein